MNKETELKEGLTKLLGGRSADEVVRKLREGREPDWLEKRKIADDKPATPLTQDEVAAIQSYLQITPSQGTPKS